MRQNDSGAKVSLEATVPGFSRGDIGAGEPSSDLDILLRSTLSRPSETRACTHQT